MDKFSLQYDKKNAINMILGSLFIAISGILGFLVDKVRQNAELNTTHMILLVVLLLAYGGFIALRWFYYNSRTIGHLPMLSKQELREFVQKEIDKVVE